MEEHRPFLYLIKKNKTFCLHIFTPPPTMSQRPLLAWHTHSTQLHFHSFITWRQIFVFNLPSSDYGSITPRPLTPLTPLTSGVKHGERFAAERCYSAYVCIYRIIKASISASKLLNLFHFTHHELFTTNESETPTPTPRSVLHATRQKYDTEERRKRPTEETQDFIKQRRRFEPKGEI